MNNIIVEDARKIINDYRNTLGKLQGKTVYIAGATGMVGSYLVFTLMEYVGTLTDDEKPTVIAGVRSAEKARELFASYLDNECFRIYAKDVTEITPSEIGPVDYIIHAASSATPTHFKNDPMGIINSNIIGTEKLLDAAHEYGARFCFVSTMEIYGEVYKEDVDGIVKVTEEDYGAVDPLDLRSAYPESKRMAENICIAHAAQYGTDSVIARLSHTYGPGMGLDDTRVQTQFMKSALNGEGITLLSDGTSRRTYTYIADACSAILLILLDGVQGEAYNIANEGTLISIKELAEIILGSAGESAGELSINIPTNDTNMWSRASGLTTLNAAKLVKLGWQPAIDVEKGVKRTLAYHEGH